MKSSNVKLNNDSTFSVLLQLFIALVCYMDHLCHFKLIEFLIITVIDLDLQELGQLVTAVAILLVRQVRQDVVIAAHTLGRLTLAALEVAGSLIEAHGAATVLVQNRQHHVNYSDVDKALLLTHFNYFGFDAKFSGFQGKLKYFSLN